MKRNPKKDITCFASATIGQRGQVVIPVEIRKKLKIKNGGKFIVFLTSSDAIVFVPVNHFGEVVSNLNKKLVKLRRSTESR